jgi:hypothetical protein
MLDKISVDEYSPKSGTTKEVIVVAFYFTEEEASTEFNTYVQRGSFDVIDSEIAPNPDKDGHYVVFVEFARKPIFLDEFMRFIKDIENLSGRLEWKANIYTFKNPVSIYDPAFRTSLVFNVVPEEELPPATEEDFFDDADEEIEIKENQISFGNKIIADLVGIGSDMFLSEHILPTDKIQVLNPGPEATAISAVLGNSYDVASYKGKIAIFDYSKNQVAIINNAQFKF